MRKQEGNPNLNQGGNEGNAYGAGAPRKVLRKRLLDGADKTAQYWLDVAKGNKVIVVPGFGKNADSTRRPSHEERSKAWEMCLRFGLGTQNEVLMVGDDAVFEAIGRMLPDFVAPDRIAPFLERLKEELGADS